MFVDVTEPGALVVDAQSVGLDWAERLEGLPHGLSMLLFRCKESQVSTVRSSPSLSGRVANAMDASLVTNTLSRVLELNSIPNCNAVVVTSDPAVLSGEAIDMAVGSVAIYGPGHDDCTAERYRGYLPDFIVETPEDLGKTLSSGHGGYISESVALRGNDRLMAFCIHYFLQELVTPYTHYTLPEDVRVIVGGRYYVAEDPRSWAHLLTHRILDFKRSDADLPLIGKAFRTLAGLAINTDPSINAIVAVPPRRGNRDRFGSIVRTLSEEFNLENLGSCLSMEGNPSSQKSVSSVSGRYANLANCFACTKQLAKRHVILLDDIMTSGATIHECVKVLYDRGAASVSGVVLAATQFRNEWRCRSWKQLPCPSCGSPMQLRFAGTPGHGWSKRDPFFGCSGFWSTGCRGTIPYQEGRWLLLERNAAPPAPSDNIWL